MLDGFTSVELKPADQNALSGGRKCVYDCMINGDWWTLWELQEAINTSFGEFYSENTLSARIRDLRKPEHGNHKVERRSRCGRTYEYRLLMEAVQ